MLMSIKLGKPSPFKYFMVYVDNCYAYTHMQNIHTFKQVGRRRCDRRRAAEVLDRSLVETAGIWPLL